MFRSIAWSFFLISAVMAAVVPETGKNTSDIAVQVLAVDGSSKLKDFKLKAELIPTQRINSSFMLYSIGNRASGDGILSQTADYLEWDVPRDVQVRIQYPTNGTSEAILTKVEILVFQITAYGPAYLVSGGIGQSYIVIDVHAYNSTWFDYKATFYGI